MRLTGWLVTLTVMSILLTIFGISTGFSGILEGVGLTITDTEITFQGEGSKLWDWILGSGGFLTALGISALGSLAIGLYTRSYDPSLVVAPFLVSIGQLFVSSFVGTVSYVDSIIGLRWLTLLVSIIFVSLSVGFIMSIVNYFRGYN